MIVDKIKLGTSCELSAICLADNSHEMKSFIIVSEKKKKKLNYIPRQSCPGQITL